jgi:opacity protein-like surface antigen
MTPDRQSVFRYLTFAAALAATTTAFAPPVAAADFPLKAPPIVAPLWSGFYVGVHGGWGWASSYIHDPLFNSTFDPQTGYSTGPIAGGQLGVNWQYGNVVVGGEIDGSWALLQGSEGDANQTIPAASSQRIDFHALATATGRLGYAVGPWLAYVKGGGAWADMELTTGSLSPQVVTYDRSRFGAAGGVGLEVAFLRNVSAKIEYNFLYFPPDQLQLNGPHSTSSINDYVQLVKVGINVHLGADQTSSR